MSPSLGKTATDGRIRSTTRFVLPANKWQSIAEALYLSERELDVVKGVVGGESEAAIARGLGRSSRTVHGHLDRIFRKLQITSRCELVTCVFATYVALQRPQQRR